MRQAGRPAGARALAKGLVAFSAGAAGWLALAFPGALGSVPVSPAAVEWRSVLQAASGRADPEGGLLRAAAYVNLGRIRDALDEVDALSRLAYRDVAQILVPQYEAAVTASPGDLVALNCLAFGYYALDRMDAAIAALVKLVQLDAANPWPRNLLAIAYLAQEQVEAARATAQEALRLDPGNQYSHLILAVAYYRQHDYIRFVAHYVRGRGAAQELQGYLKQRSAPQNQSLQGVPDRAEGDAAGG